MLNVFFLNVLQRHIVKSARMPLFGQILAALYQTDVVEEEDIKAWHARPSSQGADLEPGDEKVAFGKTWIVGAHMIHQLEEQESSEEDEDSEDDDETPAKSPSAANVPSSDEEEESGEESE